MKKNLEIEALRGIAILAVLIGHIGNLLYWIPGVGETLGQYNLGAGVDLFFCISGFVIASAYFERLEESHASGGAKFARESWAFLLRRVFRIMPGALFWLGLVTAGSVFFNETGALGTLDGNLADMASVLFNVSNLHFAKCIADGYTSKWCGYNGIYWSVSLEEQFYLFFPLLVLSGRRIVIITTLIVFVYLTFVDRSIYTWFCRIDGLLGGICVAFAVNARWFEALRPVGSVSRLRPWSATALACISIAIAPSWPEYATLMCIGLVALSSYDAGYCVPNGVGKRILVFVGTRSFSLYLAHNPVFWMAKEVATRVGAMSVHDQPLWPVIYTSASLCALALASELSYQFVEVPSRRLGRAIASNTSRSMIARAS